MEGLQAAEGEGELFQAIIGQREGHEVTEEVEICDPTESPRLTQHGSITPKETLLFVVGVCESECVCVCLSVCLSGVWCALLISCVYMYNMFI